MLYLIDINNLNVQNVFVNIFNILSFFTYSSFILWDILNRFLINGVIGNFLFYFYFKLKSLKLYLDWYLVSGEVLSQIYYHGVFPKRI